MRQNAARALQVLAAITVAAALLPVTAACTTATARTSRARDRAPAASQPASDSRAALPIPRTVLRQLPDGVFYFTAGPNPASYNLWEASNSGQEIQLTHNPANFGISSFGAAPAGIIMADARTGLDQLARLTRTGIIVLKDSEGSGPTIDPLGRIRYSVPPSGRHHPFFELRLRKSFSSPWRVIYRNRKDITENAWGPKSIAILVGSHYPGTKGPEPELLVQDAHGKTKVISTGLGSQLAGVMWGNGAARLVVSGWNGDTEILSRAGERTALPSGWHPETWNAGGTKLMVFFDHRRSHRIGLWSPGSPHRVSVIGGFSSSFQFGQIAWLAHPAQGAI